MILYNLLYFIILLRTNTQLPWCFLGSSMGAAKEAETCMDIAKPQEIVLNIAICGAAWAVNICLCIEPDPPIRGSTCFFGFKLIFNGQIL